MLRLRGRPFLTNWPDIDVLMNKIVKKAALS